MLAVVYHRGAVDEDVLDAYGVLVRVLEGGPVDHCVRVEHDDVGGPALLDQAPVTEAEALGREAGHLVDGGLQVHHGVVADVASEDARVGAVESGVRLRRGV